MSDSTPRRSAGKSDFPLSIHKGTGYWCKKVRGRVYYFGKVADDPKGVAALEEWLRVRDDLLAGREPRPKKEDELVLGDLCNQFLTHKQNMRDGGELSPRTFEGYYRTCEKLVKHFKREKVLSDISPADFRQFRAKLAKKLGVVALGNEIPAFALYFGLLLMRGYSLSPFDSGKHSRSLKKRKSMQPEKSSGPNTACGCLNPPNCVFSCRLWMVRR